MPADFPRNGEDVRLNHRLLDIDSTDQLPQDHLSEIGDIFAVFDERSQDSGNISYGVQVADQRFFVKTAGIPDDPRPFASFKERVAMLRNADRFRRSCCHASLPHLHNVIESPHGPMLVYDWVDGELLHADSATRHDPRSTYQRFRRLPVAEILCVLDVIYDLHDELSTKRWIAVDFYDGCLIYDFTRRKLHVVDLDLYHQGPFVNAMGRMFGSSRYMAPEEFEMGALIDERTTVFTLGRSAANLLSDGTLARAPFRGSDEQYKVVSRACRPSRRERFTTISEMNAAWCAARV